MALRGLLNIKLSKRLSLQYTLNVLKKKKASGMLQIVYISEISVLGIKEILAEKVVDDRDNIMEMLPGKPKTIT